MPANNIRRLFLGLAAAALLLILLGLLLLVRPLTNDSDGRIVLEFLFPGNPSEVEVYQALIRRFEDTHPHIRIKEIHPSSGVSLIQKLQIQIGGRVPPDVCWLDVGTVYQFAKYGGLIPLDDFINAEDYDLTDFAPQEFLKMATCEGKLYGIPNGLNCSLTFYNIDYFHERGVPTPDVLAASGEWTWDKFIEAGVQLTDLDKRIYSHDVIFYHPWTLSPILDSYGEKLVDLNANQCFLDSPRCISVLNMLRDFIYVHKIRPQTGDISAVGADMFMSGQVAMNFMGRWFVPMYSRDIRKFRWGVAPMPAGPLGTRTPMVGDFYCIPKHARHPAEAWELIKFLTGVEGQSLSARMGLLIPSRKSVALSPAFLQSGGIEERYNRVFIDEIYNHGVLLPVDEHFNRWASDTLTPGLENAFANRETIESAVRRLKPEIEAILAESD